MFNKVANWFRSKSRKPEEREIDRGNIPQHVAIIMDGNGRWAERRGMPRVVGHHAGMKVIREITRAADELGVKTLTFYAFSTENWKRPREEVDFLMKLPQEFLTAHLDELVQNNIQVRITGSEEELPPHTVSAINLAREKTGKNTGLIMNFALNYGSRREIIETMQQLCREVQAGILSPDEIDEQKISSKLGTADLPDPDLLIRTSGEIRLSNFMLWQLAYTELWFTDVYWPDFTKEHFFDAVKEYQSRARRYGAI